MTRQSLFPIKHQIKYFMEFFSKEKKNKPTRGSNPGPQRFFICHELIHYTISLFHEKCNHYNFYIEGSSWIQQDLNLLWTMWRHFQRSNYLMPTTMRIIAYQNATINARLSVLRITYWGFEILRKRLYLAQGRLFRMHGKSPRCMFENTRRIPIHRKVVIWLVKWIQVRNAQKAVDYIESIKSHNNNNSNIDKSSNALLLKMYHLQVWKAPSQMDGSASYIDKSKVTHKFLSLDKFI